VIVVVAPTLADVAEVSGLVESYRGLELGQYVGRLAPSLGLIIEKDLYKGKAMVSTEFSDTAQFLSITHLDKMIEPLRLVNSGLNKVSEAPVAISLIQEMGFGKTHFLNVLWHLYVQTSSWRAAASTSLEDIQKRLESADYQWNTAERAIVFALDLERIPLGQQPYDSLFETAALILEMKAREQKIKTLVDAGFLRSLKALKPVDAAEKLVKKLAGIHQVPVLVIIDELYAGIYKVADAASEDKKAELRDVLAFVRELLERSRGLLPLAFVYASANQDVERWSRVSRELGKVALPLVEATQALNERVNRLQPKTLPPLEAEDAINIVIRRLIRIKVDRERASGEVASYFYPIIKDLAGEEASRSFSSDLEKVYPFSPSFMQFASKLLQTGPNSDFPNSQHVRDLLRFSASTIAALRDSAWGSSNVISIANAAPFDIARLMEGRLADSWLRVYETAAKAVKRIPDHNAADLASSLLTVVYAKSITQNVARLVDMIRAPETVQTKEVDIHGTTKEDLIIAFAGAVPTQGLQKFNEVFDLFASNRVPYVNPVEFGGTSYLTLSFISGPAEIFESFRAEELVKAGVADADQARMSTYFKNHLVNENSIVSKFQETAPKRGPPNLVSVEFDDLTKEEKGSPRFLQLLDNDIFTILVVSPWSYLEANPEGRPTTQLVTNLVSRVEAIKAEIESTNMFAIVLPEIEKKKLKLLCENIAQVKAAKTLVDYFKGRDPDAFKKRKELLKKTSEYKTLEDIFKEETKFEDIVAEIIESLQKSIERYVASLTTSAVDNYVSTLVGLWQTVVTYDPTKEAIESRPLSIALTQRVQQFDELYAELPTWMSVAVKRACSVKERDDIKAALIEYIRNYSVEQKDALLRTGKLNIQITPIVEAILKGWNKLPVKAVSKTAVVGAIKLLPNDYLVNDPDIDRIRVTLDDSEYLQVERITPPQPPPPPEEVVEVLEVGTVDNVILGLKLLERREVKTADVEITMRTKGRIEMHGITRDVADAFKLDRAIGTLRANIESVKLTVYLDGKRRKEDVVKMTNDLNLDLHKVTMKKVRYDVGLGLSPQ
jgi:hypothetical protein